jgi:DNA-binding CsgD family transcriptional regulator
MQSIDVGTAAQTLHEARLALRAAWYDTALSLLDGCEDWPTAQAERAALTKAEVLGRRDPVAALEYLTGVEDLFTSVEGRFGRDVEAGWLYSRTQSLEAGESRYAAARKLAGDVPAGESTLAHHAIRVRWLRRDCDVGAPEFALAFAHPDPHVVASTYNYRGWFHSYNGDYRAQIADCRSSLAVEVGADEPHDAHLRAKNVYTLAQISFEIAHGDGVAAARVAAETLAWTPDLDVEHFGAVRFFGWDSFMRGQPGPAQWSFKEARAVAPSVPWQIMSHLDRAYVARISKNDAWSLDELAEADRLARDVRWETAVGEERQVLPVLATLYARVDAVRAQRYAAIYGSIGSSKNADPLLAIAKDPKSVALTRYAQGLIELALGRRDTGVPALAAAYDTLGAAGYHYRATLAAGMLYEATGEQKWREASVTHAKHYPDCPLATFADEAAARDEAMPRVLSPLQQQIARALVSGAELAELSRRFSRSLYTIERQVADVFAAFEVRSRAELLEVAQARGLM